VVDELEPEPVFDVVEDEDVVDPEFSLMPSRLAGAGAEIRRFPAKICWTPLRVWSRDCWTALLTEAS
jgi:hypothetical protein